MQSRGDHHEEHDAMANEEHVERIKRSVSEWNQWRQDHRDYPGIRLDLRGANLININLSRANLINIDLRDANLREADLSYAHLSGADLTNASLRDADLSGAYLVNTNLSGTDIDGANLTRANLSDAYLSGANLSHVHFWDTTFVRVNLSNAKGLGTAIHQGPSTVNIDSVVLPTDEYTRLHFLRGVGWTSTQIEDPPALLTPRPIKYRSLFISYASQDEVIAKRLYADLSQKDVPCWFAPHDLQPGNYFRERIDQAIHSQDKLLLLLSEHSIRSGWVRYEIEQAIARENRQQREILFPIRLDDAIFHCQTSWTMSLQATRHIGDFTNWQSDSAYQEAFSTLLRHLKVTKL